MSKLSEQLKNSILYFEKYPELLNNKLSKVILFGLLLINFSLIIGALLPSYINYNKVGGFDNFIINSVPEFEVENNKLIIDSYKKTELQSSNVILIFDPSNQKTITDEDISLTGTSNLNTPIVIKITPNYILSNIFDRPIDISIYLEYLGLETRDDLFIFKQPFLLSCVISFLLIANLYAIVAGLILLMASVWVNFFSVFYKIKLSFSELIKFTIYINAAPMTLEIIFQATNLITSPFRIVMPSIVYFGVAVAYAHFVFKYFQQEKLYTMPIIDVKL